MVDVQNDFCEGGAVAVAGGSLVAGRVRELISKNRGRFRAVVASRDRHVNPGTHFAASGDVPDFEISWPVHCVVGSQGAEIHPSLADVEWGAVFDKGRDAAAFSAFEGREASGATLATWLLDRGIDRLQICGIATDYCVQATVLGARQLGFEVEVLADLTAGVRPESSERALASMAEAGARISGDDVAPGTVAGMFSHQLAFDDQ
ncbi:MAG: isochorismatase family protein [Acidimicrobiales bacterium]